MLRRSEALRVAIERALEQDYLVELHAQAAAAAAISALPPHPRWHAPLLVDCSGNVGELNGRIEIAGELWLGCCDISKRNVLIVTNCISDVSYVFQRAQGPRCPLMAIGPIVGRLLSDGLKVGPNPVLYRERTSPLSPDELCTDTDVNVEMETAGR